MKCLLPVVSVWLAAVLTAVGQPSYWFSQWEKKPDAQTAQQFFMVPGANVTFTYATNHVIINSSGGGGPATVVIAGVGITVTTNSPTSYTVTVTPGTFDPFNAAHDATNGFPWGVLYSPASLATNAWLLNGNTLGQSNSFLGTIDLQPVQFKVHNTRIGLLDTNGSVSFGSPSAAYGVDAVALGHDALADNVNSVAVGGATHSSANAATSIGAGAHASGVSSAAIGQGAIASAIGAVVVGSSTSSGQYAFSSGFGNLSQGNYSVSLGLANVARGVNSFVWGNGGEVDNDGSMVLDPAGQLITDTANNQFLAEFQGGAFFFTAGNGLTLDDQDGTLVKLKEGDVLATHNAEIQNVTHSTNGLYYVATNNGIAGALNALTPLHAWATLSGYGAGPFVPATVVNATYYRITNYVYAVTNLWGCYLTKTNGILTNALSGWYRIGFSVSAHGASNDGLEVDVITNGVAVGDVIAAHFESGAGANRNGCASGVGRMWLTNNSQVSLAIQNRTGTTLVIDHVQLDVGP